MNALPPSFPGFGELGNTTTVERLWTALHEAAEVVATLAAAPPRSAASLGMRDFPAHIHAAGGWRLSRAESELADLTAIMEHGLDALLSVNERGADPRPAARQLLAEFEFACGALKALLPPLPEPVFAS